MSFIEIQKGHMTHEHSGLHLKMGACLEARRCCLIGNHQFLTSMLVSRVCIKLKQLVNFRITQNSDVDTAEGASGWHECTKG